MDQNYIVDVNEADFQYEVLQYSHKKPVVVDFWAEWCEPCKTLGPVLEDLAENSGGQFRLARVDVDENQNLANQYNIRGIPAVKGFRKGTVVGEFVGALPRPDIEKFLRELTPSKSDLLQAKGESLLAQQDWARAESCFRAVLKQDRASTAAMLGYSKTALAQNKVGRAKEILAKFPASKEYGAAEILKPFAAILDDPSPNISEDPLEATFQRSLYLYRAGQFHAALDGLIETIRMDKDFRDGDPRQVVLGILELLGADNPMTRQYRSELASVLF